MQVLPNVYIEPALADAKPVEHFQFFAKVISVWIQKARSDKLVFNRTVTLKDAWAKEQKKGFYISLRIRFIDA